MKITFVLPYPGIAGGIRVIAIYAEQLQKRGHQVYTVCLPPQPISWKTQVKSLLKGEGWLQNKPEPAQHFDGKKIHRKMIERYRPITAKDVPDADVVIATWWETAEWVAKFPPQKGTQVYFVQHYEVVFPGQPAERVEATWQLPMQKIVVANWLAEIARTKFQDDEAILIPNSVNTEQFFAPPRQKQPIFTVGLMYTSVAWKGCDISLKALALAAEKIPQLRLVAFSSEPPSDDLPLPAGTQYYQRPPQEQIKDIYAQCDVWLFGSRFEGFGLPILEAMACRTPVIGTPAGAAPELLDQGAGILVAEDAVEMASAIERVYHMTDSEWQTMSEAAYRKAVSYTWEDAAALFEAALHQAIEQSQPEKLLQSDLV